MKKFYIYTNQLKDKDGDFTHRIRDYLAIKGCVCAEKVDDTVGKNESRIAEYIRNQLKEDELGEQLVIPSANPFTGRK